MSNTTIPSKPASLHMLCTPGDGEDRLLARSATDVALLASGLVEGELVGRETNATAKRDSGQRCVEMDVAVVRHDPGVLAELVTFTAVARAAACHVYTAESGSDADRAQARSDLDAAWPQGRGLPADVVATAARLARQTVDEEWRRVSEGAAPSDLVARIAAAEVTRAARDVVQPAVQRLRLDVGRVTAYRDACLREGRVAAAVGAQRALDGWAADVLVTLDAGARDAHERAERAMADANQHLGEMALANEMSGPAPSGAWARLRAWVVDWLIVPDQSAADSTDELLPGLLRQHLEGRLGEAAALALHAEVASVGRNRLTDTAIARVTAPVLELRAGAERAIRHLEEQIHDHQRRTNGIYLPADADVRRELSAAVLGRGDEVLAEQLVAQPLAAAFRRSDFDQDAFEEAVLVAARRLTDSVRQASLGQVIDELSDGKVASLAHRLVNVRPDLQFRAGYPAPDVHRRVAAPGGAQGRLGQAIRRIAPQIDVMATSLTHQPLVAHAVSITEVFAPFELHGYFSTAPDSWRSALESARREGWDARLFADRRLKDEDDGIVTDEDVDLDLARAIAADVVAPSKEPPESPEVGGTWYYVPAGQPDRPSHVDPARLDSVFRGHRLGKSLPEIRRMLRRSPQHREMFAVRWDEWCEATRPAERVARMDQVISRVLLPSDELVPVCRAVKNGIMRDARVTVFEVA